MGKSILVTSFLIISSMALYVFFSRDDRSLRDQVSGTPNRAWIVLEDYAIFRYRGHRILSTLSGKVANFVEPNRLEMFGDLRGMRHDSERKEFFNAESSTTIFVNRGLVQLMNDPTILKTEVENNVQFGFEETIIFTQYAEYLAQQSMLRSDLPVLLRSPQGDLHSKTGFEYDLKEESIELYGPIQGTLQNSQLPVLP